MPQKECVSVAAPEVGAARELVSVQLAGCEVRLPRSLGHRVAQETVALPPASPPLSLEAACGILGSWVLWGSVGLQQGLRLTLLCFLVAGDGGDDVAVSVQRRRAELPAIQGGGELTQVRLLLWPPGLPS